MASQRIDALPSTILPVHYQIFLNPDLVNFVFDGEETIELRINHDDQNTNLKTIDRIVTNSKELKINQAFLMIGEHRVEFKSIDHDEELGIVNFVLLENLDQILMNLNVKVDDLSGFRMFLHLKFRGELNDKLNGFYRSKYVRDGVESYAAVTQFQPADARKCFVCWDEPIYKAVFEISLVAPKNYKALSNMNCVKVEEFDEMKNLHKFAPTVPMSTYLVAVIVGDFDYVETICTETSKPIPVRVYTPVGKKEQGLFSLEVTSKVLALFEKYFQVEYPLPKLDMIGISQLSFGGMENFGLITFREQIVLVDPKNTSASAKQNVSIVVAHEVSHQWFGNHVTPAWWESLWLNESYATYWEYFAIDSLFPEWGVWEQFVYFDFLRAFDLDGKRATHPIQVPVNSTAEIDEVFDAISYSKGSCCVRMLIEWLGIDQFRKGIIDYLNKYAFSNAKTEDLWTCLKQSLNVDAASMMKSWIYSSGYPVVTINELVEGDEKVLTLTQNRYLEDGGLDSSDPTIWYIPISYVLCNSDDSITEFKESMNEKSMTLRIPASSKWIKFNKNQIGFYRVNYQSSEYYTNLKAAIKEKKLSPIDRMALIEESTTLSKSGLVPIEQVLSLFEAYSLEDNYTVLATVSSCLSTIENLIKHESEQVLEKFAALGRSVFLHLRDDLGWTQQENESHLRSMTRSLVFSNLVSYNDKETVQKAFEKFAEFKVDPSSLIPDLRSVVYSAVVKYGTEDDFKQVLNVYLTSDLTEEKVRVLKCLGQSPNENLIDETINRVLDGSVLTQDISYMLMGLTQNPKASEKLWRFFFKNYPAIREKFQAGLLFGRIIKLFTESSLNPQHVSEIKDELDKVTTSAILRTVNQVKETISLNSAWSTRSTQAIVDWLNKI